MWQQLLSEIQQGNIKSLARTISLVENEYDRYFDLLGQLPDTGTKIIGITGPPGAGKSTLTDALIYEIVSRKQKVGVLCVDPSSTFNLGALLGDRIRMSESYNHPDVFIRSLATRGSLGGLHPMILEIADIMKAAPFDFIIIETVGVGQSEVEIAGLADATVVVVVPEAGDEVQTMKAGLMEIADIFVVNKSDRPDADIFVKNLRSILGPDEHAPIPVVKTIASTREGVPELYEKIVVQLDRVAHSERKYYLLAERAYQLIQQYRMSGISKKELRKDIESQQTLNLYQFIQPYIKF